MAKPKNDKEKKELIEDSADKGKKKEKREENRTKLELRNRQSEDDDNDLDLDNRWGMDDLAMQRGEIEEITEEDVVEEVFHDAEELVQGLELSETEEAFHGFELEEVEKALELQAKFGADNDKDATEEVLGSEVSPSRRKNLSPKERRKRKAAAKARSGE